MLLPFSLRDKKIGIISHDAGGAEILSSFVLLYQPQIYYCLDGPALNIFNRKIGSITNLELEECLDKVDVILCGTSWQSEMENIAFEKARVKGIHSIAFLDHWVNYKERFCREGKYGFPDEIWVGDEIALKMAQKIFTEIPVSFIANPYFEEIKKQINSIQTVKKKGDSISILFVAEPIAEHALKQFGNERYWGFTEFDSLEFFLNNLDKLTNNPVIIKLRPHPSEDKSKYDHIIYKYALSVRVGGDKTLLEEIAAADIIVGSESMAMVIGLLANKRVVSCIPILTKKCSLPFPQIEILAEKVN